MDLFSQSLKIISECRELLKKERVNRVCSIVQVITRLYFKLDWKYPQYEANNILLVMLWKWNYSIMQNYTHSEEWNGICTTLAALIDAGKWNESQQIADEMKFSASFSPFHAVLFYTVYYPPLCPAQFKIMIFLMFFWLHLQKECLPLSVHSTD